MGLLSIFTLVVIDSNTRLPLVLLSAATIIGLGMIFALLRAIHRDLSALSETLDACGKTDPLNYPWRNTKDKSIASTRQSENRQPAAESLISVQLFKISIQNFIFV